MPHLARRGENRGTLTRLVRHPIKGCAKGAIMRKIYYLAEALHEHSVGEVASGIELNGCYCDDQYGRFVLVDEGEKAKVLSVLSEFHKQRLEFLELLWSIEPEPNSDYSEHSLDDPLLQRCDTPSWDDPVWRYGWPEDKRPVFSTVSGARRTTEKPLTPTERNSLLVIIAALCNYSDIKPDERGASVRIMKLTEDIGAPVGDDTVRSALAKIPDALQARGK